MKCVFPNQTRDPIETLYHPIILKKFPAYKLFWENFVGVRIEYNNNSVMLYPYKLKFVKSNVDPKYSNVHILLCMYHYSCFSNLACAHYYFEELKALKLDDKTKEFFTHWRVFDSAYLHLGAAWQQMQILWETVTDEYDNNDIWIKKFLENNKSKLAGELEKVQRDIIDFRNKIAHFARFANIWEPGKYKVPINMKKNEHLTWFTQIDRLNFVSTTQKLEQDLNDLETFFDQLHQFMIPHFQKYLSNIGIEIDYDSGDEDNCSLCGHYLIPKENQMLKLASFGSGSAAPSSFSPLPSGMVYNPSLYNDESSAEMDLLKNLKNTAELVCSNSSCQNFRISR